MVIKESYLNTMSQYTISKEMGHLWVEVEISDLERKKSTKVKALLGVVVLESLGFDIDPTTGTLKERPLLLY